MEWMTSPNVNYWLVEVNNLFSCIRTWWEGHPDLMDRWIRSVGGNNIWKATTSHSSHLTNVYKCHKLTRMLDNYMPLPKKVVAQKINRNSHVPSSVIGWGSKQHPHFGHRVTSWPSFWNSQFTLVLVLDSASSGRARPAPWSSMRMVSSSGRP